MIDYNEIKAMTSSQPSSVIKSIQRGVTALNTTANYTSPQKTQSIVINEVNTYKSIIIISSVDVAAATRTPDSTDYTNSNIGKTIISFENSKALSIASSGIVFSEYQGGGPTYRYYHFPDVSWQVIEFN